MLVNSIILFLSALIGGMIAFVVPNMSTSKFKHILIFAGSYLLSITVVHILPELYDTELAPHLIGLYVLLGFFLQYIIEKFTSGVEHGHVHLHEPKHTHSGATAISLLVALSIHAFMEGTLLVHPAHHGHHDTEGLVIGIALHKMPAAFALMSVLTCILEKRVAIICLILFSLTSPFGLTLSHYLHNHNIISENTLAILFALVAGNFLHISTTIFLESSPGHKFDWKKVIGIGLGAACALLLEHLL